MYKSTILSVCILLVTTLLNTTTYSQNQQTPPPPPCSSPETSQFDFWLGEWELTWPAEQFGGTPGEKGKGTNTITKPLGDCVIQEEFRSGNGSFNGHSVSVYNAKQKTWKQTWVDNQGSYMLFTGKFKDGKMELRTAAVERNGKTFVSRMVFKNIKKNSLNWDWQRSDDGGETWTDLWNIQYERKKDASVTAN